MSGGVQGIIVSGEASESEEEEFCAVQIKVTKTHGTLGEGSATKQPSQQQQQQYLRRTHVSLLHQKLWEANASLERNLTQCFQGPVKEQSARVQHLSGTLSAVQTSTLAAHTSLSQASRNLSRINFLLTGLADNPLFSLKRQQ